MYRKNRGHKMVTKCCKDKYARRGNTYICKTCNKLSSITIDDGKRPVKIFSEYKPVKEMSQYDRNDEFLKRAAKVAEYTIEIKGANGEDKRFIEERIEWNNKRMDLLLQ